ncbi:MAG: hypothetical protein ACE5OP_00005 [Candidatus Glassbacteria bacterium]
MAKKAKVKKERGRKPETKTVAAEKISADVGFSSLNIKLLIFSVAVIIAGFIFLSQGSVTLAPILLVLGYCVLVPISIIYRSKKPDRDHLERR